MKINEYNGAMKHIARRPTSETIKKAINPEGKPMPILDYIKKMNSLYSNYDESEDPRYVPPAEMEDIKKSLPVSPLVKEPKKQIIKKTLIVEKPAKPKPLIPEWDWRLSDWTDLFDEDAPPPPPEDIEKVLNIKKKEVAGLEALLNLHKKFVG